MEPLEPPLDPPLVSMVKLTIWNNDYTACEACQPRGSGGIKIRSSKGESVSVFNSFSVENNGISVYQNTFTFPLNQD